MKGRDADLKKFMDEKFLLGNKPAERLYFGFAEKMPIYDYHCHIDPRAIAENKKYRNITEIWLGGDHYKWRVIRANGVDEKYITGDAGDREKFFKWCETVPYCIGNPLYHWTHLELKRYFGIDCVLSPETAGYVWDKCNEMLKGDDFSVRAIIKKSNVKLICTTDDPADDLGYHRAISQDKSFDVKVLPAFRPDKGMNIEKEGFRDWVGRLADASGIKIGTFDDLKAALRSRMDYFHNIGCRVSDHALDPVVYRRAAEGAEEAVFLKALKGEAVSPEEAEIYKTAFLTFAGREYAARGWVMQLHMSTLRNNNSKMMKQLGPDTGFDTMGDFNVAQPLVKLLNAVEESGGLPKMILYSLNAGNDYILGAMTGCFQDGSIPGKIQFGSAWWFNDHKDGMEHQLKALANTGLLSRFAGMLTDSRSFLSYTRHEYFRRILCNLIGTWIEKGEVPADYSHLGRLVEDICYNNAVKYFGIDMK